MLLTWRQNNCDERTQERHADEHTDEGPPRDDRREGHQGPEDARAGEGDDRENTDDEA